MKTKAKAIDDLEWARVFELRCRSKRGKTLSSDELARCERAYRADPSRYTAMNREVFVATAPFGSAVSK